MIRVVPVRLWHGSRDRAVPVVHGRWLATHVPGIAAHISESEDHTNVEHNHKEAALIQRVSRLSYDRSKSDQPGQKLGAPLRCAISAHADA